MTEPEISTRAEYAAGLRELADLVGLYELPLPFQHAVKWRCSGPDAADHVAFLANRLDCVLTPNDPAADGYAEKYLVLSGAIDGLPVEIHAARSDVSVVVTPAVLASHPAIAHLVQP